MSQHRSQKTTSVDVYFYTPKDSLKQDLNDLGEYIESSRYAGTKFFPPNVRDYQLGCRFQPKSIPQPTDPSHVVKIFTDRTSATDAILGKACRPMAYHPKSIRFVANHLRKITTEFLKKDKTLPEWKILADQAQIVSGRLVDAVKMNQAQTMPTFKTNDVMCMYVKGKRQCSIFDGKTFHPIPKPFPRSNTAPSHPIYYLTPHEITERGEVSNSLLASQLLGVAELESTEQREIEEHQEVKKGVEPEFTFDDSVWKNIKPS